MSSLRPDLAAEDSRPSTGVETGRTVEFRIHGIGNHSAWSSLGNPRIIHADEPEVASNDEASYESSGVDEPRQIRPNRFVESYSPPPAADQKNVWLVNWARTSRRTARFAWFLAIPITMINVAGHMQSAEDQGNTRLTHGILTAAVHVASLLMTISVFVWTVVIVETVLKHAGGWDMYLFLARTSPTLIIGGIALGYRPSSRAARWLLRTIAAAAILVLWFTDLAPRTIVTALETVTDSDLRWDVANWTAIYQWTVVAIGVGFALLIAGRALTRRHNAAPARSAFIHVVLFTAAGVFVAIWRPAQWNAPDWMPTWATVPRPAAESCTAPTVEELDLVCTDRVDVVTLVIVITTGLSILLSLIVLASATLQPSSAPSRPNLAGAALLISLAAAVIHALGSTARVSLDWLLAYADKMISYVDPLPGWPNPVPFRALTPYDSGDDFVYRIDLVILGALVLALSLGIAAFAVWLIRSGDVRVQVPMGTHVALSHRIVKGLPQTLGATVLFALPLFVLLVMILGQYLDRSYSLPGPIRLAIALTIQSTAVLLALLFSGRLTKARDILERFADVAGFWRVTYHPLAGASYRPHVLRGILHEIRRSKADNVVVVGHSQGSILAASIVGQHFEADACCRLENGLSDKSWRLVTCGSPLASLYGSFFPHHIGRSFLEDIRRQTAGRWTNCWRASDPIASRIPEAKNQWLPDPRPGESRAQGHGDYWTDPDQLTVVAEYKQSSSRDAPPTVDPPGDGL